MKYIVDETRKDHDVVIHHQLENSDKLSDIIESCWGVTHVFPCKYKVCINIGKAFEKEVVLKEITVKINLYLAELNEGIENETTRMDKLLS